MLLACLQCAAFACLHTIFNGWCTGERFGMRRMCPLCRCAGALGVRKRPIDTASNDRIGIDSGGSPNCRAVGARKKPCLEPTICAKTPFNVLRLLAIMFGKLSWQPQMWHLYKIE